MAMVARQFSRHLLTMREIDAIREDIEQRAWDRSLGAYAGELDGEWLDASLLLAANLGYSNGTDGRMRGTARALQERLGHGALLHRFEQRPASLDGEGAFTSCSFWAIEQVRSGGTAVLVGFCAYVAGGWLFSLLYYWVLAAIGIQTWWMGALLGALHGATLLLAVLPVLPHLHPRMASEYDAVSAKPRLEPPGMLGLNYGPQTPLTTMLAQVVFGTLIGGLPQLAAAM